MYNNPIVSNPIYLLESHLILTHCPHVIHIVHREGINVLTEGLYHVPSSLTRRNCGPTPR